MLLLIVHFFLLVTCIPSYRYTTIILSIYIFMNYWVFLPVSISNLHCINPYMDISYHLSWVNIQLSCYEKYWIDRQTEADEYANIFPQMVQCIPTMLQGIGEHLGKQNPQLCICTRSALLTNAMSFEIESFLLKIHVTISWPQKANKLKLWMKHGQSFGWK